MDTLNTRLKGHRSWINLANWTRRRKALWLSKISFVSSFSFLPEEVSCCVAATHALLHTSVGTGNELFGYRSNSREKFLTKISSFWAKMCWFRNKKFCMKKSENFLLALEEKLTGKFPQNLITKMTKNRLLCRIFFSHIFSKF